MIAFGEQYTDQQADEQECRQAEWPVHHRLLAFQVHEVHRDERRLSYRDADADDDGRRLRQTEVRHADGDQRQHEQRTEHKHVTPDLCRDVVTHSLKVSTGQGKGRSIPRRRSANRSLRLRCGSRTVPARVATSAHLDPTDTRSRSSRR